jgi:uncharacterized RDD family membrane protein YckC
VDATYEGAENTELSYKPVEKQKTIDYNHLQAGFWIRFWAYLIDLLVIGSVNRIVIYPLFVLMTKYFNQTLGKMIFGIKVISIKEETISWGTILFRELIGRYISKTIWIGYIIVAFTPKKQGLHDIFSDTQVIHEKLFIKYAEAKSTE